MNVNIFIFCDLFEGECPIPPGSALTGRGLDLLKRSLFERLDVIRVYANPPARSLTWSGLSYSKRAAP